MAKWDEFDTTYDDNEEQGNLALIEITKSDGEAQSGDGDDSKDENDEVFSRHLSDLKDAYIDLRNIVHGL